ncbi:MAG: 50S ribosomal protein L29 [Bacteroidia bacterium]|nr:50S ribosomal protein L29 [Bacteroidia bacterium]HOZ91108.1 50S ribosomal protein L29 [Bacteroidia bacterium]HQV00537.1 50S ribosomal protein L29 [Bacteroidia bacterium]
MKQNIVKDLTNDELRDKLAEERSAYTKIKITHQVSPLENPMKIRAMRRTVARLKTEMVNRQLSK